jgi:muramoyltetrapeptide carboxypeptidase
MAVRKPFPPAPGGRIRVVAPCSPFDRERFEAGLACLAGLGWEAMTDPRAFAADGFLAGPDADRAASVAGAFADPEAGAILAARGGYGSMRLLESLAGRCASFLPIPFCGFSDVTALHRLLADDAGLVTFHGPNVTTLPQLDAPSLARFAAFLAGADPASAFRWEGLAPVRGGRAEGRIVAGNLSMISALWGTRWAAPLDGTLLVLEDVGEPAYRLDRMLVQLALQPGAGGIAGIAFGDLGARPGEAERVSRSVAGLADRLGVPVVAGFPAGHGASNHPVPQGVRARIDADAGLFMVEEDPFNRA